MKIVSLFNNKGGVGKTTLAFHLSWILSEMGKKVLIIDLDPQCNLTICGINEDILENIWKEEDSFIDDYEKALREKSEQELKEINSKPRSIHYLLKPTEDGLDDLKDDKLPPVIKLNGNLGLIPGRLTINRYENVISERWSQAYQGVPLSKWKVTKQLTKYGTGGNFSVCYLAEYEGKEYFLKALDFSSIDRSANFVDGMSAKINEFRYERDLSNYCKNQRVNKVVVIAGSGEEIFPNYIIGNVAYLVFEKADCDVRKFMNISEKTDIAWCFKSLKDIAVGLRDLHNVGVSHQDLKPSNILVFEQESKISDLGRSMCENLKGPYNDWLYSGDQTYAPLEVFYRYEWTKEWHLKNYMTDCFLLGNLITFYLTGATVTALMGRFLPHNLFPGIYNGSFNAIASNLLDAYQKVLDNIEQSLPKYVDKIRVKRMIETLCYPIPEKRGHPKAVNSREPNYDLQRYITELDYLRRKTELELYRLTLK